jgi:hypothetical protein
LAFRIGKHTIMRMLKLDMTATYLMTRLAGRAGVALRV